MLYWVIIGKKFGYAPFDGKTNKEIIVKVLEGNVIFPEEIAVIILLISFKSIITIILKK